MLRKITLSIAIGLLFFVTNTATAQTERGRFSIHIGPTIPLDDFGEDDIEKGKALGAGIGLGLGIEYIYPLTETGVGLFFGIDVNYNATTSDFEEEKRDEYDTTITRDYYLYGKNFTLDLDSNLDDITFPKYFNIPISAGFNYTFKADDKLSVYTNLGLVYNFLKITDYTATADITYTETETIYNRVATVIVEGIENTTITYDLASSFGVKIGGGIILNDKIYILLNYFGLGKHKIKTETEIKTEIKAEFSYNGEIIPDKFKDIVKTKVNLKTEISMLALTIGFRL